LPDKGEYLLKFKLNQGFSTFDFLTMMASLVVIVGISAPILKKNLETGNIEKAQVDARKIASELLYSKDTEHLRLASGSAKPEASGRGVASVGLVAKNDEANWAGSIGKDPWGNPYHFKFLRNENGMPVEVKVWSEGPEMQGTDTVEARVPLR
jgi:hypothetical protein